MIRQVRIKNYKSIPDLTLDLGRVTVLIGANGSGKSNILEAMALASAACQKKLDNEFLISRGIRVTDTRFMRPAFDDLATPSDDLPTHREGIRLMIRSGDQDTNDEPRPTGSGIWVLIKQDNGEHFGCELCPDSTASYPQWRQSSELPLGTGGV